jgi:hypothetical protein
LPGRTIDESPAAHLSLARPMSQVKARHLSLDLTGASAARRLRPARSDYPKLCVSREAFRRQGWRRQFHPNGCNRAHGWSQHGDTFEASVAAAGVLTARILTGAEVRYLALAENGTFESTGAFRRAEPLREIFR